ncbi:MAG: tRNA-dihydrouridine synthase family protein [Candidatus Yanofskybacteria bacterium]|nr:tRNA-dihydrouridine synthase family protein [Candidatus Yanofskybacteria bacterium]
MSNFWEKLNKPFFVLAPMANVTDWAFRKVVAKCGRPNVFYTEFLSCDGILHDKTKFEKELYFEKSEKPIVVQFFGSKPENFYKCAQLARELGFDGIDINMGCPDRNVEKQGAGAALIKNHKLAQEIVKETQRGAGDLPVSVKTRLGYNKIITKEWVSILLETELAAIIVHGRTRKEISQVPAHWEEIGKAAEMAKDTKTLIIGNGDIVDMDDARQKAKDYSLDGIMVGRGIFANPWFFNEKVDIKEIKPGQRIELLREHLDNFEKLWGDDKRFDTMKKFFKVYISGWPACPVCHACACRAGMADRDGAKELRAKLMTVKNKKEVVDILQNQL